MDFSFFFIGNGILFLFDTVKRNLAKPRFTRLTSHAGYPRYQRPCNCEDEWGIRCTSPYMSFNSCCRYRDSCQFFRSHNYFDNREAVFDVFVNLHCVIVSERLRCEWSKRYFST